MEQEDQVPKFEWFKCPLIIQLQKSQQPNSSPEIMSLKSQATFYDADNIQCPIDIVPELLQDPLYDGEIGFNWHKSWLIPSIKLKSQLAHFSVSQEHPLRCYMTSCYPVKEHENNFLREVKLQGNTEKMWNGYGETITFNNLKFKTTSFKINGARLSLLIIVMVEANGMVLSAMISSPIYIDSRKQARLKKVHTTEKIQNTKFNQQLFIQLNNEKIKIYNNMEDFITYYSAPNIRFKLKHPFYVCYKFSKCFTLYYNAKALQKKNDSIDTILEKIWEAIQNEQSNKIMIECEYTNFEAKKKVLSIFNNWRITFINFVFNKEELLENYVPVDAKLLPNAFKVCSSQKPVGKTKEVPNEKGVAINFENYFRTEIQLSGGWPQQNQWLQR